MNLRPLLLAPLVAALAFAVSAPTASARVRTVTAADAPRSLPEQGPVSVQWEDPAQFTEIRYSHNQFESRQGNWVEELAEHLRESTEARLAPGERLEINITDIRRAGSYEPWRGVDLDSARIMRDIYPPRMTLTFRRIDAQGQVVAEGERKLSDMAYLMNANPSFSNDYLYYEKSMIDRWASREFPGGT